MAQYIDKSALVAEIERRIKNLYPKGGQGMIVTKILKDHYEDLLSFIDTLEVKDVDDELQGIEKEVTEGLVERINKKRIPISLKGEKKAKFKNEFNTLWQTIGGIQFVNVAKHIIERLCLHFAAWGAYNLKGIGQIDKDDKEKIDIEVKKVYLEHEVESYWKQCDMTWCRDAYSMTHIRSMLSDIAKHFFELGMAVSNKAQKGEKVC